MTTPASPLDETLDPAATIAAAEEAAVTAWWQLTTILQLTGPDTLEFLENVSSQHCGSIPEGEARHTLFLDRTASILAPAVAFRAAEDTVLLELQQQHAEPLIEHLTRYRLRAKVDISAPGIAVAYVVGPNVPGVLHACGADTPDGARWYRTPTWGTAGLAYELPEGGRELSLPVGLPSAAVVGDRDAVRAMVAALPEYGAPFAAPESLDALRMELGVPFLNDFADGFMPAEVGADALGVSLTKGCYLGQEPVARLHFRGKPNRALRPVQVQDELPDQLDPDAEDYLQLRPADAPTGRAAGTLTSWAHTPDGSLIGLAILRNRVEDGSELLLAGTDVRVLPGPVRARV